MSTDSSQPITRLNTTDLDTSFTAEVDAEVGTEFIFFVRAYTRVGPGNTTSVSVLTIPREMKLKLALFPGLLPPVQFLLMHETIRIISWIQRSCTGQEEEGRGTRLR